MQTSYAAPELAPVAKATRSPRRAFWLFLIILLEIVVFGAVGSVAFYQYRFSERVYEGVSVAGIPLSGMSLDAVQSRLADELTPYPGQPVIVRYGDRTWVFGPDDLGVGVDARATAAQAYAVGRQESDAGFLNRWVANLTGQAQALAFGHRIAPGPQVRSGQDRVDLARDRGGDQPAAARGDAGGEWPGYQQHAGLCGAGAERRRGARGADGAGAQWRGRRG